MYKNIFILKKVGGVKEKREMIKMKFPVWEVRVVISEAPLEAEDEAEDEEEAGAEEILDVRHDFCFINLDERWKMYRSSVLPTIPYSVSTDFCLIIKLVLYLLTLEKLHFGFFFIVTVLLFFFNLWSFFFLYYFKWTLIIHMVIENMMKGLINHFKQSLMPVWCITMMTVQVCRCILWKKQCSKSILSAKCKSSEAEQMG